MIRTIGLSAAMAGAALLTGCAPFLGGGDRSRGPYDYPYENRTADVRGTVERVNTLDRVIVVDRDDNSQGLRNEGDRGDRVSISYDDRTTVEYQGQTFRPQDLEAGDRIEANLASSDDRRLADRIQVLYDVSRGGTGSYPGDSRYPDGRTYPDDRGDQRSTLVRGTVRYLDTRAHTVEVERSAYSSGFAAGGSNGDVVVVHYDADTVIEYQGRRYSPENLERGDQVEIRLRDLGGQLFADRIDVVGEGRTSRY